MKASEDKTTPLWLFEHYEIIEVFSWGFGAVVKISASQSWGPRFDSRPGQGLNIWWPSFPLTFTQLSILTGSVKWVPAYMDRFEAAARGAYICFRSAGGKLIIVKRLWACYMEKALYKCTTLLYFTFIKWVSTTNNVNSDVVVAISNQTSTS